MGQVLDQVFQRSAVVSHKEKCVTLPVPACWDSKAQSQPCPLPECLQWHNRAHGAEVTQHQHLHGMAVNTWTSVLWGGHGWGVNQTILSMMAAKMTGDGWKRECDTAKAELLALAQADHHLLTGHCPRVPQWSYLGKEDGKEEKDGGLQQGDLALSLTKVCSTIFKCQINCCQIWKR